MPSSLPITFSAMEDALPNHINGKRTLEELEAWLNFETMKKSWYQDENNVIDLTCFLLTEDKFRMMNKSADEAVFSEGIICQSDNVLIYAHPKPLKIKALFYLNDQEDYPEALKSELVKLVNQLARHLSLESLDAL